MHTHHRPALARAKAVNAIELGAPGPFVDACRFELGPQTVVQRLPRTLLAAARAGAQEHIVFVWADAGFGGCVNRHELAFCNLGASSMVGTSTAFAPARGERRLIDPKRC